MKQLSIVIPCFNEESNIPIILERFSEIITSDNIEIILVNNGSVDNSQSVIDSLIPSYRFAKSIYIKENQGYGYGILEGLKHASGNYVGWTHADLQTDPKDIIKVIRILENIHIDNKNIFIKGNRKGRPLSDTIFTVGMSLFESVLLKSRMWDINAQPTIFHRSFLAKLSDAPKDFSLDLFSYYLAKRSKFEIIRFNVAFPEREHGTSSWNVDLPSKVRFIKRTINYSFSLKKRFKEEI